jgi:AmiR/NasT family two-component response regulator
VIEQARGVLAAPGRMGMSAAFDVLRSTARRSNRRLAEVAADVVAGWDTSTSSEPGRQGSDRGLATRVV